MLTTEHLEDRLLFKDAEDFKVGMNYVAVLSHKFQLDVLAFILMSNHLHFVMFCTRELAESFINAYKQLYSRYLQIKYGCKEYLRRNGVDIRLIPTDNEALEKALAYVQMNCVAANICCSPLDQVIVAALPDLCWSLFRKQGVKELSEGQVVELMRQIRFRFSANVNQIARVTGFLYEEAAKYLDRV